MGEDGESVRPATKSMKVKWPAYGGEDVGLNLTVLYYNQRCTHLVVV